MRCGFRPSNIRGNLEHLQHTNNMLGPGVGGEEAHLPQVMPATSPLSVGV